MSDDILANATQESFLPSSSSASPNKRLKFDSESSFAAQFLAFAKEHPSASVTEFIFISPGIEDVPAPADIHSLIDLSKEIEGYVFELVNKTVTTPLRFLTKFALKLPSSSFENLVTIDTEALALAIPHCLPERSEIIAALTSANSKHTNIHKEITSFAAYLKQVLTEGAEREILRLQATTNELDTFILLHTTKYMTDIAPLKFSNLSRDSIATIKTLTLKAVNTLVRKLNAPSEAAPRAYSQDAHSNHKRYPCDVSPISQTNTVLSQQDSHPSQPRQARLQPVLSQAEVTLSSSHTSSLHLKISFTNLSNVFLDKNLIHLLNRGLNFIIKPSDNENSEYTQAFNKLVRNIRIKYLFTTLDSQSNSNKELYIPNPTFEPPLASPPIENYLNFLYNNLLKILESHPINNTYDRYRVFLLKQVSKFNKLNLIIKPADKNLGPVVMTLSQYNKFCLDILTDNTTYQQLDTAPIMSLFTNSLLLILERNEVNHNTKLYKYLTYYISLNTTRTSAKFYILPKIHKSPIAARPIVSNVNYITRQASKWLDFTLQPILPLIPTYIKDSKDIICDLETLQLPTHFILMSADINSLYPSIPIELGLTALYETLNNLPIRTKSLLGLTTSKIKLILDLSAWVLNKMYITYNDNYYLQIKGTAMGTPFAVAYSCIFLHHHEQSILASLKFKPLYFKRFIDDIFIIVHAATQATKFIEHYTSASKNITLTSDIGYSINFLDLTIFKGPRFTSSQLLDIKIYQKPNNAYMYIHTSSFHKEAVHINLYKSELLRYRLSCTQDDDFENIKQLFFLRLTARGHKASDILLHTSSINLDRPTLIANLKQKEPKESLSTATSSPQPFIFTVTNSPRSVPLKKLQWFNKIPEYILSDPSCELIFNQKRPIVFGLKNPPKLSSLLS